MTPDAIAPFLREFGLPLAMLAAFAWAILRRKLVTGAESDGWKALYEREREDRIAAQKAVGDLAGESANVAEAVAALSKSIVTANVYDERLRGKADAG